MDYVTELPVFFDMLDALHMLHNAAYLVLFERARQRMSAELAASAGAEIFDWPYYVARNEINYRAAIYRPQSVTVRVWLSAIGRTSATFQHQILRDDGSVAADGVTVLVRVDAESRTPVEWSTTFRRGVAQFVRAPGS